MKLTSLNRRRWHSFQGGLAVAYLALTAPVGGQSLPTPGALQREVYQNIPGAKVTDLTESVRYRSQTPNAVSLIYGAEAPVNVGSDYGQRLRGWVTAPLSGTYTFYIASDDYGELWLGRNSDKISKELIARVVGWTTYRKWDTYPAQASIPITLVAGQRYYIEALQKESGGGDHLSIAWKKPGATSVEVVPANALTSYVTSSEDLDDDSLPDAWEASYGLSSTDNGSINPDNGALGDPDGDGVPNWMEFLSGTSPINAFTNGATPDHFGVYGFLQREVWSGLPGTRAADLTGSRQFLGSPSFQGYVAAAEAPVNVGDNYGQRLRGRLIAPVDGSYTFWISGDDQSELWLSTTDNKAQKIKIATVAGYSKFRSWDESATQKSLPIILQAGREYYLEILEKEGSGGDHVSVAWAYSGHTRDVIAGQYLRSFVPDPNDLDDDGLPDDWERAVGLDPNDNGFINPANGSIGDPDGDGFSNYQEYLTRGNPFRLGGNVGCLSYELWDLPAATGKINDLIGSRVMTQAPTKAGYIEGAETPVNQRDRYGMRVSGTLTAPVTGDYTFWLASDDGGELWLSQTESMFRKRQIAATPAWSGVREFDKYPAQKSALIRLEAGKKYYLEALLVEAAGSDHLSIAWSYPGLAQRAVIDRQYLAIAEPAVGDTDNDNLPDAWELQYGLSPNDNGSLNFANGQYADPDGDGLSNFQEWILATNPLVADGRIGYLGRQLWENISGTTLAELRSHSHFLQPPDLRDLVSVAAIPVNIGDNYGQRLRGILKAPVSGLYTFWVSGDNNCEFWLSTDLNPFKKERLAWIEGAGRFSAVNVWNKFSTQKSREVTLVAGQEYFVEIWQKEASGGDHVEFAWTKPGYGFELIPAAQFRSILAPDANDRDDDGLPDDWERQHGLDANDNGNLDPKNGALGDLDADHLTNLAEYLAASDPSDFYNGSLPSLRLVGGDQQIVIPGAVAPLSLSVQVRGADGAILVGAPVQFTSVSGGGLLAANPVDTMTQSLVTVRSDPSGVASVSVLMPSIGGAALHVQASAISGGRRFDLGFQLSTAGAALTFSPVGGHYDGPVAVSVTA